MEITNVNNSFDEVQWWLEEDLGSRVFCLLLVLVFGRMGETAASLFADRDD